MTNDPSIQPEAIVPAPETTPLFARVFREEIDLADLSQAVSPKETCTTYECLTDVERKLFITQRDMMPETWRPFLTPHTLDAYKAMGARLYLTSCGRGGYGIVGEELISVFSHPKACLGPALIREAIGRGAKMLDCIDVGGKLTSLYKKFGFEEVQRLPWRDDLAPADWPYEQHGRPDIVLMRISEGPVQ